MSEARDKSAEQAFADLTELHREIGRIARLPELGTADLIRSIAARFKMNEKDLAGHVRKERRRLASQEAAKERRAAAEALAENPTPTALPDSAEEHFRLLGHDHGTVYFLPRGGEQVVGLKPQQLASIAHLLQMAPLQWWRGVFPNNNGGMALNEIADALIQAAYRTGVYDPARIRGRGAWFDKGRTTMHLGDHLLVGDEVVPLSGHDDGRIYERGRAIEVAGKPLSNKEGKALIELCRALKWRAPKQHGTILAGAVASGAVCGGLEWRAHTWITGEAGLGKSWVVDHIVKPALDGVSLQVQGASSEPGIRRHLRCDALAVVFDESEPKSAKDRERIQAVLDLARQASSDGAGEIVKGTPDGGHATFRIRSSFIYASVNCGVFEAADQSRTVTLALASKVSEADRKRMEPLRRRAIVPELSARLLARMVGLLPALRKSADVFATAIGNHGHDRRTGDTYGTLLAGAWMLEHERAATPKQAAAYLRDCGLLDQTLGALATPDEPRPDWQSVLVLRQSSTDG